MNVNYSFISNKMLSNSNVQHFTAYLSSVISLSTMMSVIYTLSYIHHLSMWWSLYIGLPQTASLVSGGEGNVERDFYLLFHFTHFNHWSVKPVQFLSVCYVC